MDTLKKVILIVVFALVKGEEAKTSCHAFSVILRGHISSFRRLKYYEHYYEHFISTKKRDLETRKTPSVETTFYLHGFNVCSIRIYLADAFSSTIIRKM